MTENSRPWNGTTVGDSGPYSDTDWQELYQAIIGYGAGRANNGVLLMSGAEPADGLKVQAKSPATTQIEVLAGAALIQGIAYLSDATESFTIAANASGNPRIDTIVLQADYALQTVRLVKLQGTPAASPVAPTLTQSAGVMWEIPIADIAVANGFVTITDANISPRQEWVNASPGVYLDHVLNNSGAILNDGDVVIWDTSADRAVTRTATRDHKKVAGVVRGQIASGAYGRIQTDGIGYVRVTATTARGDLLVTSTTNGSAVPAGAAAAANAALGSAMEARTGAGLVLTNIHPRVVLDEDWVVVQDQKASGTTGGTTVGVTGAWTTSTLNTEVTDTGAIATLSANRINLPAGFYSAVWIRSFGANVGASRTRLRDITNGVTLGQAPNTLNPINSIGACEFTLAAAADIELQFWVTTGNANGLGAAVSTGDVEVYANVFLIRHAETP